MPLGISRLRTAIAAAALGCGLLAAGVAQAQSPTPAPQVDRVMLADRCNNVALTWGAGTALSTVAAAVTPSTGLESIWRYDNADARFYGYSPLPGAPNDYTSIGMRLEPVFVCMRVTGELARPRV